MHVISQVISVEVNFVVVTLKSSPRISLFQVLVTLSYHSPNSWNACQRVIFFSNAILPDELPNLVGPQEAHSKQNSPV